MLLLLRMHDTCVARVCRSPVRINGMHRTQSDHTSLDPLSLVIQSNQACFDHQIRETYTKHSVGAKTWPGKPVNLVPESHFPFEQISSIYPTTAAKARNWYQRWLWWKGTRILVWKTFHLEKQDFLSYVPLLSEIFRWNEEKSRVPFTFQPEFLETSCRIWPSIVNCEWVFINYFSRDWNKFGKHA